MRKYVARRPSPAMVIAMLALFVALSTGSYAAIKANTIGAKQIKPDAVRASELKDGGVGSAELGDDSVGSGEVQNGAITAEDVQDETLGGGDIQDESLGSGDVGGLGPADVSGLTRGNFEAGQLGPAAFARVQADGTVLPALDDFPATSRNIDDRDIRRQEAGLYCIDLDFRPASAMVALDNAGFSAPSDSAFSVSVATERGNTINPCTGTDARVRTTKWTDTAPPTSTDHPFVIWFEGG